jgi:hypothetical protein
MKNFTGIVVGETYKVKNIKTNAVLTVVPVSMKPITRSFDYKDADGKLVTMSMTSWLSDYELVENI